MANHLGESKQKLLQLMAPSGTIGLNTRPRRRAKQEGRQSAAKE